MTAQDSQETPLLPRLMTPRETAKTLAISERTLWSLTQRGMVPSVRIGRSIRYDPRSLSTWIKDQQAVARSNSSG